MTTRSLHELIMEPVGIAELLAAKRGGFSQPALRPAPEPGLRGILGQYIFDAARKAGLGGQANRMRSDAEMGMDFVPGLGAAVGGEEAGQAIGTGHYLSGGADLAMSMVPGGKVAGKGAKKAAKFVEDYWGGHRAPRRSDENAPLHELTRLYPDDVYGPNTAQYYGHAGAGDPVDEGTARILRQFRGNPDAEVTVYRAVPKDAPDTVNPGDWVTINPQYAKTHGEGPLQGNYKIIKAKARAKDLFTDANSIHEFGYDPE